MAEEMGMDGYLEVGTDCGSLDQLIRSLLGDVATLSG
jgi:hypothetical protein